MSLPPTLNENVWLHHWRVLGVTVSWRMVKSLLVFEINGIKQKMYVDSNYIQGDKGDPYSCSLSTTVNTLKSSVEPY